MKLVRGRRQSRLRLERVYYANLSSRGIFLLAESFFQASVEAYILKAQRPPSPHIEGISHSRLEKSVSAVFIVL